LETNFARYGVVTSAKVMSDVFTGLSRGFGFVKYQDSHSAKNAIEQMNGKNISNKKLVVKYADTEGDHKTSGTPSPNVYTKGIPLTMDDQELMDLFSSYGKIVNHKLMIDRATGESKCQAFIQYEDVKSAEYAIAALHGYVFPNSFRGMVVRFADTDDERTQRKQKAERKQIFTEQRDHQHIQRSNLKTNKSLRQGLGVKEENNISSSEANLFIYHLPQSAEDNLLYNLFSPYGKIQSVKVVKDKSNGQCKGYGFVKMMNYSSAYNAMQGLNGLRIENKTLQITWKDARK